MKAAVLEIAGAGALERRLSRTLEDLATIGDKRAGSAGGAASAGYILQRFRAAGLETSSPVTSATCTACSRSILPNSTLLLEAIDDGS